MKTSSVYRFKVMMMMMVILVYAASVPDDYAKEVKKVLLKNIQQQATNLSKTVLPDIMVMKVSDGPKTCVPNFFCLAERILDNARHDHQKLNTRLSNLTRTLHQYNNQTGIVTCPLKTSSTYRLRKLLEDVKKCARHSLNATVPKRSHQ